MILYFARIVPDPHHIETLTSVDIENQMISYKQYLFGLDAKLSECNLKMVLSGFDEPTSSEMMMVSKCLSRWVLVIFSFCLKLVPLVTMPIFTCCFIV